MQLQDRFYKSTEVADILGVSLRTLYRYMDSHKIESVQLPSGRHRFTKKQIEDFLYTNNLSSSDDDIATSNVISQQQPASVAAQPQSAPEVTAPQQAQPQVTQAPAQQVAEPQPVQQPVQQQTLDAEEVEDQKLEEELDALLASLDDDFSDIEDEVEIEKTEVKVEKTFSDLESTINQEPVAPAPQPAPVQSEPVTSQTTSEISGLSQESDEQTHAPVQQTLDEEKVNYFYCPYNDLRTVAKMVKKVGDDKGVDYAFTMNAGLSLFFPLDPFSVIHFYINQKDLDLWKSELQLKDTTTEEANLGILMTTGQAFEGSREVSGLKVVSKSKLIENLKTHNMNSLADQADSKLD